MTVNKTVDNNKMVVAVTGRLDTNTAPQLESELKDALAGIEDLTIDMKDLQYISSAGLRVLLSLQKTMNKQGSMVIKNVCDDIQEIFEVTGFVDILTIE